jgi:hypothetical protein
MGYSIRTERYRYTEWDAGNRGVQLFDYLVDPGELNNLAQSKEHEAIVAELRTHLHKRVGQAP